MRKVLVVGCGSIAGGFDIGRPHAEPPLTHAGGYTRHGGFELVACVDPDTGRREAFARHWGVAASFEDLRAVRQHVQPGTFDVISLCSPTGLHAQHAHEALALRPRLIFCEKPVASTLDQARALVAACHASGVSLAVNHSRRWAPDVQRLAAELKSGRWGAVRGAVGTYTKGVLNNGSHMLDLLHLLLGPMRVMDVGRPVVDHREDDPSVPARLETLEGVPVHLCTGHAEDCAIFELRLITSRAILDMEDGGSSWRIRQVVKSPRFKGYRVPDLGTSQPGEYLQAMRGSVANLHAHLESAAPLACTGETALSAHRLCDEILRRARPFHRASPDLESSHA